MVTIFFVEKINLVVEYFHADEDASLLIGAPAERLHLPVLRILLIDVLVVITISVLQIIEKEW